MLGLIPPKMGGGPKDMLLVEPIDPVLPSRKNRLVMLHLIHANRSQPMTYDEGSSTFTCVVCGEKISLSDKLFLEVVGKLSSNSFLIAATVPGQLVYIAHLLEEFPDSSSRLLGQEFYAVKRETQD
jgi:hypothetical protein